MEIVRSMGDYTIRVNEIKYACMTPQNFDVNIYRALPTFWTLSSSTGFVCCFLKKELAILQNLTRVLLALRGQRHRMEHLIPTTLVPAMLEALQETKT